MKLLVRAFVALGLLSALAGPLLLWFPTYSCCSAKVSNERNASATLKTLATAEADFRQNDRDGDGFAGYWRADVAGLYGLCAGTEMIKLIEISAAGADVAPVGGAGAVHPEHYAVSSPKAGYWFAALRFADEEGCLPDPDRFVFCAVPDTLSAGGTVYAVTHEGVVWEAPARGARDVPRAFPLDPAAAGWRRGS